MLNATPPIMLISILLKKPIHYHDAHVRDVLNFIRSVGLIEEWNRRETNRFRGRSAGAWISLCPPLRLYTHICKHT